MNLYHHASTEYVAIFGTLICHYVKQQMGAMDVGVAMGVVLALPPFLLKLQA